jgi:UDP:flavonoid glycosyltransferase YjiC (YdhE family)
LRAVCQYPGRIEALRPGTVVVGGAFGAAKAATQASMWNALAGPDGLRSWHERGGLVRIVFAALPAYGHLYPLMPLALAAADAGHDVGVATGVPFLGRLPLPTVSGFEPETPFTLSAVEDEVHRRYPELRAGFPATLVDYVTAMFGEVIAELVLPAVRDALVGADVVVYEAFNVGAAAAARDCGIPAIAFGLGSVPPPLERIHQRVGLPGLPDRYLDPMPPLLESGAVGGIADRIAIRPVAWSEPVRGPPPPWPHRRGPQSRPRVYVTLGTVVFGRVDVLRRIIDELAELTLDVLVVVGPEGDVAALGALPTGVQAERFVPQDEVLDQVDLVVHHGGTGTTLGAAAAGVPQLLLPQAADQFRNAAAAAGVGRGLPDVLAEPAGTIRAAALALLSDRAERDAARQLAAAIAAMPAPADVVRTLFSSC